MPKRKAAFPALRRVALSTGGGDAPGLNAVLRAATIAALHRGWEVVGIRDGFGGLLSPADYPEGGLLRLSREAVKGITHVGGTILGTTNRGNPFAWPVERKGGKVVEEDRSAELIDALNTAGVDALVAIGGDGTLGIAHRLAGRGVRIVGVPKTIDNDLDETVATFGFDSAVSFATECVDRLHATAEAHRRILVVEVMGRYAGWIALHAGVSGSVDAILIPEIPYDIRRVASKVSERFRGVAGFAIVVVAEGARPRGGGYTVLSKEAGREERLGGVGEVVARELERLTGHEARHVVLGHLLRGGGPTTFDRLLALRFGAAAVRALAGGHDDVMVALDPPAVRLVPLARVAGRMKTVPLDSDTVATARELGIAFGD
ncbi:MAG TPA: ATP-dependent 6-phosphofructokinase [Planctomycetota bacterium]|nr:ATP-dependent 6-phosphofructokinase [Planctomycetota bacterium]